MRRTTLCRTCLHPVAFTPTDDPNPEPDWVERCDRCLQRELERQAAEAEAAAKLALWAPRRCPQCGTTFAPAVTHQRFCTEKHRKQHHRQAKAARQRTAVSA